MHDDVRRGCCQCFVARAMRAHRQGLCAPTSAACSRVAYDHGLRHKLCFAHCASHIVFHSEIHTLSI